MMGKMKNLLMEMEENEVQEVNVYWLSSGRIGFTMDDNQLVIEEYQAQQLLVDLSHILQDIEMIRNNNKEV